jgi:hypothetical protein
MGDAADKSGARAPICQQRAAIVADGQLALISREQLQEIGFSNDQIRRRVRDGFLHPRHHNVYSVGQRRIIPRAHLLAALLSLGPRAFLSHRTAAAAWGLRPINVHNIEVTVPGKGVRRRDRVTVHRTEPELHPDDVRVRDDLRVSSVSRMLVELAPRETPAELERLVTTAVQKRLIRLETPAGLAALEQTLARHPRFPGRPRLTAVLAGYRSIESHRSKLELAFDRFLRHHPEIPDPERNIHIDVWEVDRYWPARRLAVELDGRPYHVAVRDMERDRVKDAALQRLGHVPIRFTDFRFDHDRSGILRDLHHFLGVSPGSPAAAD